MISFLSDDSNTSSGATKLSILFFHLFIYSFENLFKYLVNVRLIFSQLSFYFWGKALSTVLRDILATMTIEYTKKSARSYITQFILVAVCVFHVFMESSILIFIITIFSYTWCILNMKLFIGSINRRNSTEVKWWYFNLLFEAFRIIRFWFYLLCSALY